MNKFKASTLISIELQTIENSLMSISTYKRFIPIDSDYYEILNAKKIHALLFKIQELRVYLSVTKKSLYDSNSK